MGDLMVRPANGAAITTQGFAETAIKPYSETAASAIAAREEAEIQARYIMALRRPRDTENFRVALLKECKRPGFAEKAEYSRPVGKEKDPDTGEWKEKIAHGASVHFVRAALRLFGNNATESKVVFDSGQIQIHSVTVTDYETNVIYSKGIVVEKTMEKRGFKARGGKIEPPKGREIVGERANTDGDTVYTVVATPDEVLARSSNLLAKTERSLGEKLLPRDIVQECLAACRKTVDDADAQDPDAAIRKLIDAFAELSLKPTDLEEWLGHRLDRVTPAERKELRAIYTGIRDGETTWEEIMEAKDPTGSAEAAQDVAARKLASMRKTETEVKQASEPKAEQGPQTSPEALEAVTPDKPKSTGRMKL